MKYSSHLYYRTDGTLGRFPIIAIDSDNVITSIKECGETLIEESGVRFFAGVIVPAVDGVTTMQFCGKEDFISQMKQLMSGHGDNSIIVGNKVQLMLISGFDLSTFHSRNAKFRLLTI